jgi:hypothetical protein
MHPDHLYEGLEGEGEHMRYRGIAADIASVDACVQCHNNHPKSPKRDFQKGDVMGGIVVSLPVEPFRKAGQKESEHQKRELALMRQAARTTIAQALSTRKVYAKALMSKAKSEVSAIVPATDYETVTGGVPTPETFIHRISDVVEQSPHKTHRIDLVSLWAINSKQVPRDRFEMRGLEYVAKNPDKVYEQITQEDGERWYRAIVADVAVADACVKCHNNHPLSPKKDFKRGDVMGGFSVALPMPKNSK